MNHSQTLAGQSFRPIEVFVLAGIVYFVILFPITRGVDMLYRRVAHLGRS
jgi:polar amino acid transport system permease protein